MHVARICFCIFFVFTFLVSSFSFSIDVLEPSSNGSFFRDSIDFLNVSTPEISTNCYYNVNFGINYSIFGDNSSDHFFSNISLANVSYGLNVLNVGCYETWNYL